MKIEEYQSFVKYIKTKGYLRLDRLLSHDKENRTINVVSMHSPCEKKLPFKVNIAFNLQNIEEFENVEIEVISARHLGRPINQIPLGHHCDITFKYQKWTPLFDLIKKVDKRVAAYSLSIGLCEKEDWDRLKEHITRIKIEGLEE